ncbi:MAG: hypothetical protein MZV63_60925 [Marinilabiliales bacterium]|nr:hypothetical protein [Marinilabiliales bacterium]
MSFYGIFLENNQKILAMISILPEGTLQFKGISDVNDLFSVLGLLFRQQCDLYACTGQRLFDRTLFRHPAQGGIRQDS